MFATKWTSLRGFLKCKKRWGRCAAHNNMWGDVIHCSSKKWDWLERFTQERWNWAAAFLHLMNELTRPSSPCSVQCSKNSEGLVHLTKLWNCLWRSWAPAWRIKGTNDTIDFWHGMDHTKILLQQGAFGGLVFRLNPGFAQVKSRCSHGTHNSTRSRKRGNQLHLMQKPAASAGTPPLTACLIWGSCLWGSPKHFPTTVFRNL